MGKGGGGSQVTGYRYFLSMLTGLCRGPVDEVVAIKIGDLLAWQGSVTVNGWINIDADNLFGGDTKEGGVKGSLLFAFGYPTQTMELSPAPERIGGLFSGLRGVMTAFWDGGHICSNSPYPKPWVFRVRRAVNGWYGEAAWYPEEAIVNLTDGQGNEIKAMNGAHIIYECLTNPIWGRGLPIAALDDASFRQAADVLCREKFGLCLAWQRASELGDFLQTVINHIGAALYLDRSTGLINLRLIRQDYDPEDLPIFDYSSGLLEIKEDSTTAPDNSHSEIVVTWRDPVTNSDRQTRVQNLAGTQTAQTTTSTAVSYPGIPNSDLAARVAQRDLMMQGSGIKRYSLVLDRRGRKITPAGVIRISVPERGINNMVLRIGSVVEGTITAETITVVALQDVFGLETTTYLAEPERAWVPPDRGARFADTRRLDEINYRDTVRFLTAADLAMVPVDSGGPVVVAAEPTALSTAYELDTAGTGEAYAAHGLFPWTPTATLATALGYYETLVTVTPASALSGVGAGIAWIDDECVEILGVDVTAGALSLGRGCVDTVPVPHMVGARIWFPEQGASTDGREYTTGEVVRAKVLTQTTTAAVALVDAPEDAITITGRQGRPYPPGDFRIGGTRFGEMGYILGDAVLTWVHRDRITQADHILVHADASTGPEAGTTYTTRVYDDGGILLRTTTGITGTTWTYTTVMATADGPHDVLNVQLESVRGGLASHQHYSARFLTYVGGWGNNYGNRYGG